MGFRGKATQTNMRTWEGEQFLEEIRPTLHKDFGVLKGHLKRGGVRDRGLRLSHHGGDGNRLWKLSG